MRESVCSDEITYIENLFAKEDDVLVEVRRAIEQIGRGGVQIRSHEGRLLQFLCRSIKAEKVVEVGMLLGYSTIWLARALPDSGKVYSLEKSDEYATQARSFFTKANLDQKIDVLVGDALTSLESLEDKGPFDLVFIDANKAGYLDYLLWAENNIRSGGMIIGDNTFLFGHVLAEEKPEEVSLNQWKSMREFNRRLAESKEFTSILIPTSEGLTVAVKA